uniref:Uncharacterized protein n=1 Tax=Anguilla anguilla TaxID=7936 RepID=A0A0E9XX16_ANGAN
MSLTHWREMSSTIHP